MIMSTFKLIAVSNWELYQGNSRTKNIEEYVKHLAGLKESVSPPDKIILREKHLSQKEYEKLLGMVWKELKSSAVELIPHTFLSAAQQAGIQRIHLPFHLFEQYTHERRLEEMKVVGTSIHSVEEAKAAEKMGASYIIAGHIFATECKQGVEPRGIEFLTEVCRSVEIPVYAIGGIHPENLMEVRKSGASGACMMSEYGTKCL